MHKVFTPPGGEPSTSYFIKSRVVGNYNKLYEKCKELQVAKDNYDNGLMVDQRDNTTSQQRVSSGMKICCCAPKHPKAEYNKYLIPKL